MNERTTLLHVTSSSECLWAYAAYLEFRDKAPSIRNNLVFFACSPNFKDHLPHTDFMKWFSQFEAADPEAPFSTVVPGLFGLVFCSRFTPLSIKKIYIKTKLSKFKISSVFVGHDSLKRKLAFALADCFKERKYIFFGDGPGFLLPILGPENPKSITSSFAKLFFWSAKKTPSVRVPDYCVTVFKTNSKQTIFSESKVLLIPPSTFEIARLTLKKNLTKMFNNDVNCIFPSLKSKSQKTPSYLLLTSCFSKSGYMSAAKEIDMLLNKTEQAAVIGSTIAIYKHPMFDEKSLLELSLRLAKKYEVVLPVNDFNFIPIELVENFCVFKKIICFSGPTFFLYNHHPNLLHHALDEQTIKQYFYPEMQDTVIRSNATLLEEIAY